MGWILPVGFVAGVTVGAAGQIIGRGFSHYAEEASNLFTQEHPSLATLAMIPLNEAQNLPPIDQEQRIKAINALQAFSHAYTSAQIADDFTPILGPQTSNDFSRWIGDTLEKVTHNAPTEFNIKDENRDLWNNDHGLDNLTGLTKQEKADELSKQIADYLQDKPTGLIFDWKNDPRIFNHDPTDTDSNAIDELPALQPFFKNLERGVDDLLGDYGWALENPQAILGELPPWLQNALAPIFGTAGDRPALRGGDPLIIDLDGDGVELISLENSGVFFDFLGDGVVRNIGWVAADDGFLVHDLDGDGQIESVDEMFGSKFGLAYLLSTTTQDIDAENGFAKLELLDSNGDGKISDLDTVWSSLQVWQDANSNGVTDTGELITLGAGGIESIDLAGVVSDTTGNWPVISTPQIEGHWITHSSTVTMNGGATREIVDAWLDTDLMNTAYAKDYTLDVRTLFLPTLRGYGQLPDLHIAMSLDNGTSGLLEQVQSFATSHTFEDMFAQFDAVRSEVEDILYAWAGIDEAAMRANPDFSDNGLYNLMPEYHFTRTMMGQNTEYVGTWLDFTGWFPQVRDGVSAITEGYQNLVDAFTARLVFQSTGNALFESGVSYNPFTDMFEGSFLLSQAVVDILKTEAIGHEDVLGFWNNAARFIDNTQGIANLSAAEVAILDIAVSDSSSGALGWSDVVNTLSVNVVQAADGGDSVTGTPFDDEITGGNGNDTLIGGDGDDVFIEDVMPGPDGASNDIYIGGRGNDLYIDGFGNDIFQYDYGDDVIAMNEAGGSDYITSTDAIRFGAGITPGDVSFHLSEVLNNTPNGEFNIIKIAGRGTITIQDVSNFPDHYKFIDELHFDDGTIIDFHTFFANYHGDRHDNTLGLITTQRWHTLGDIAVYGYEGDDQILTVSSTGSAYIDAGTGDDEVGTGSGTSTVYLGDGDDRLTGGDGDHIIYDGAGNEDIKLGSGDDIYHYSGGNDFIRSGGGGQNTIVLPENVTLNELSFYRHVDPRKGSHQILDARIDVENFGSISVWNQFTGHASDIVQTLQFHDGSTAQLADQDFLTIGTDGNDHFSGGYGWPHDDNTYLFGLGNDIIDDPNGIDTLMFGPGITFSDLKIYRATYQGWDPTPSRGSDLFIEDQNGNSMKIVLYDYTGYPTLDYALEHLQFSDGSVVNLIDLEIEVHGSDIAEYLSPVRKDASDDDTFFAYGGDDNLYGGNGNDVLHGGAGDDYISGDNGVDESVYQGNYSDFSITSDSNFLYVTDTVGNEGADLLYQVEILRFTDGTYDVASGVFTPADLNTAPIAVDDVAETDEDIAVSGNVLGNDTDAENETLSITAGIIASAQGGSVILTANGDYTYTPTLNFNGIDSFEYTLLDQHGDSDTATVIITVNPVNDAPQAQDDLFVTDEDVALAGNLLSDNSHGEDTDIDGDTLSAQAATFATASGATVLINEDGSFDYTPFKNFNGQDSFNYTLVDIHGASDIGTAVINVLPVNDLPETRDDDFTGDANKQISGNVLGNDFDVDNDPLSTVATNFTTSKGGIVNVSENGDFTYDPANDFSGADSFEYRLIDGQGGSNTGKVNITIEKVFSEIVGTSGRDILIGTADSDVIRSLSGSLDRMTGAEGSDIFVFGAEAQNGVRERDIIMDYEVGIDSIMLEDGATVGSIRQTSTGAAIFLEGDLDAIYVQGDGVLVGNLTIVSENTLLG